MIYLWLELNGVEFLCIKTKHHRKLLTIRLKVIEKPNPKKQPDYKFILYCICKRLGYDYILKYLFSRSTAYAAVKIAWDSLGLYNLID